MESRIEMSQHERDVLKIMSTVLTNERSQVEAARLLGISERQVRRIQRRLETEGDSGLVHRLRGQTPNRRVDHSIRNSAVAIYRDELGDFGPTLAAETLAERGIHVAPETLRRWLLAEGLWHRKRRRELHRSRRPRRECFGELVQMDTSIHDWLEQRGESMVLIAMIDDATSRVVARFYEGETVEAHFDLLSRWIAKHGRPAALYTDHDSIFESQEKGRKTQGKTQFSRALNELDVELILANSPQAKGRVERFFQTAQDRWVKALRMAQVSTRAQANVLLESKLLPEFQRRFTCRAASLNDANRPLGPRHNLAAILSIQSRRVVANDYTVRFDNRVYQLHKPALPGLRGGKVLLEERMDGTMAIRFGERYLSYSDLGALPPNPRSLALSQQQASGEKDRASEVTETRSDADATSLIDGCSGRTPAEPYPSVDVSEPTRTGRYRPPADHPWRRQPAVGHT